MLYLGKLFKLRGKSHGDEEKPLLEHLEDLRNMLFGIVLTLVISTVSCWIFHTQLLDIIRKPIHAVWSQKQNDKLPEGVNIDTWEKAKLAAVYSRDMTPDQKTVLYNKLEDEHEQIELYISLVSFYQSSSLIEDDDKKIEFVNELPDISEQQRSVLLKLVKQGPATELNAKSRVVDMRSLKPTETFMLAMKLSFFAGLVISFPILLYFILRFILPGMKNNEKRALWPAMLVGFILFLSGVFFSYYLVLPRALEFFLDFGVKMGVVNEWKIGDYIAFATQFTLIFGLAFELPVVVMALVKIGLLNYDSMSNTRSYAIVTILIIAAFITPTGDIPTLLLLAIPMCILYEICIWLAYFIRKKERKAEALEYQDTGMVYTPRIAAVPGAISVDDDSESGSSTDPSSQTEDQLTEESYWETGENDSDSYEENMAAREEALKAGEEAAEDAEFRDLIGQGLEDEYIEDDTDYEKEHEEIEREEQRLMAIERAAEEEEAAELTKSTASSEDQDSDDPANDDQTDEDQTDEELDEETKKLESLDFDDYDEYHQDEEFEHKEFDENAEFDEPHGILSGEDEDMLDDQLNFDDIDFSNIEDGFKEKPSDPTDPK